MIATRADLEAFQPSHSFFIGLDSDGCAFPSMELKHKECFIPVIIKHFGLQGISKYAREAAEFVNLYSSWRGANRFPALLKTLDLVRERREVHKLGFNVPRLPALSRWSETSDSLGNPALVKAVKASGDPELVSVLAWSNAVNAAIADMVSGVTPFPRVRESLERLGREADVVVVSQTPGEALVREWEEHEMHGLVRMIAGQEAGSKSQHLTIATGGRYRSDHILMIGDAPGDLKAAQAVDGLFYPICPGEEEQSWQLFFDEGIDRFLKGNYAGAFEQGQKDRFNALLPETPPWATAR